MPPQTAWDPVPMRAAARELYTEPTLPEGVTREVTQIDVVGETVRVFTPTEGARGVILNIHGGGLVAGEARYDDAWNALLALSTGAMVVSPDYRLAPEYPYPVPLEDCLAAWKWALAQRPGEKAALYGDSAGGDLAAGLTLWLRDHAERMPGMLVLVEPVLDDRLETDSMRAGANTPVWNLPNAQAGWKAYLAGREADIYAAPGRAADLSGFPPTLLLANQCDPLRDEDMRFGRTLTESNVPAEIIMLPRTCHGAVGLFGPAVSQRARRLISERLKEFFN